ncbi:MAG TPA: SDR family oxidoreductase [Candidatus Saccharimonadales bacterium]|nr:SDR family oxidoreductase [Candidatus Saccharimonadales bacterium]
MTKTILVTGSSRGIGKAVAALALAKGYRVIIHGKTDSEALRQTHTELSGSTKVFFDIADKAATQAAIESLGPIDVLVNNAGIARNFLKDIAEMDDDKALEEYRTNVLGTLHCIQSVLPGMVEQRQGGVINIASIKGQPNLSTLSTLTYATTKAGIIALTKALAKTYGDKGIRINSVSPGYVETDQVHDWNQDTFDRISNGTILGRIAKPEEIAPLVLFLASDDASYITGSDFLVDGGYAIKGK